MSLLILIRNSLLRLNNSMKLRNNKLISPAVNNKYIIHTTYSYLFHCLFSPPDVCVIVVLFGHIALHVCNMKQIVIVKNKSKVKYIRRPGPGSAGLIETSKLSERAARWKPALPPCSSTHSSLIGLAAGPEPRGRLYKNSSCAESQSQTAKKKPQRGRRPRDWRCVFTRKRLDSDLRSCSWERWENV